MLNILSRHNANAGGSPLGIRLLDFDSVAQIRAATPLPEDAQRLVDDAVLKVGRKGLRAVNRLLARNLVKPLPNWLSVMEYGWDKISETGNAKVGMIPGARGERSVQDYSRDSIPIYCIWDDFSFSVRELASAVRNGRPLDTSHIEQSTFRVNEKAEDICLNGLGANVAGKAVPGFLNAPDRATITYKDNEAWDAVGKTGAEILYDVQAHAAQLQAMEKPGPYELFIPRNYQNTINGDYTTGYPKTIRARLEELEFGGEPLTITTVDRLPDDYTVMWQVDSASADLILGQTPSVIYWQDGGGFNVNWVVLSCVVPRIRSNYESQSGVCVGYPT